MRFLGFDERFSETIFESGGTACELVFFGHCDFLVFIMPDILGGFGVGASVWCLE